ncbi:MAG: adenosylhomocysteinase [Bacillota bacterium]|nr:adenosylhomocysteinase [Bacillota bacterium]
MSSIRDISLAPVGQQKMEWAWQYMKILQSIQKEAEKEKPLDGLTLTVAIHIEAKTANLCRVLRSAGAEVILTGCNPLSTQDEVVAALVADGFEVFAWRGATAEEYEMHIEQALSYRPHVIIDDGGDLVAMLHGNRPDLAARVIGGCEETTTGVMRLRIREREGTLAFPMYAVNDARCKHLFDNRHGTGQSVWDAIMRNTNMIIAGKNVVVAGYGMCGRGVAQKARGLGARVFICEVDPVRALEAAMDGFFAVSMDEAAGVGDIFITATGCKDIIRKEHLMKMKDGVLLCNAGHFDVEINKPDLYALSKEVVKRRPNIEGFVLHDGRVLNLIGEGRLVNLAAGDGHPIEIMDMSFALQTLCAIDMAENGKGYAKKVLSVPAEMDTKVARLALSAMGGSVDKLSPEQEKYMGK